MHFYDLITTENVGTTIPLRLNNDIEKPAKIPLCVGGVGGGLLHISPFHTMPEIWSVISKRSVLFR
jgi:hypothetical protein